MAICDETKVNLLEVCWKSMKVGCTAIEACYYAASLVADDDGEEDVVAHELLSDIRRYDEIFGKGAFRKIKKW